MFIPLLCALSFPVNDHTLINPEKNTIPFETDRLIAQPVCEERVVEMAGILNQQLPNGELNGKYYESGSIKDEIWIEKKKKLLLGNLEKGIITCRFFYTKEQQEELACFVGAELNYLDDLSEGQDPLFIFWGTSINAQGKGYTVEAIRGFVSHDILRDPAFTSIIASVHPENTASIHLAQKALGAIKTKETWNYSRTQPRYFYEVDRQNVTFHPSSSS